MEERPSRQWRVPWRVTDVAIATAVVFAAFLLLLAVVVTTIRALSFEERILVTPWVFGIFEGLMLVAVWAFAVRKYRISWRALGFRSSTGQWTFALPWVALLGSLLFTALYTTIIRALELDFLVPQQQISGDVLGEGITKALNIAVIGVWGPFAEEVFFRGFLFAALVAPLGLARAALVSAAVFALAHLDVGSLVPIFVTGLLLAWLYVRTRSLWPPIVAHAGQNLLALWAAFQLPMQP